MKKFYFSLLLTLVLSLFGLKSYAYHVAVKNADGVTIYYNYLYGETELEVASSGNGSSYYGDIIVPDEVEIEGKILKVTSIGVSAFASCDITSISLPKTISTINDNAFFKCNVITSIDIPESVKSIGNSVFENCSSLSSVNISNGVNSIGDRAFMECRNLSSITLPNSIEHIGEGAFCGCYGLKSIILPESLATIEVNTFSFCEYLSNITIPQGTTSICEFAFYNCRRLESISFGNNLTTIGADAFENCESLKSIVLPNKLKSIGVNAFNACSSLTDLTLPSSLTNISAVAFRGCDKIATITSLIEKPFDINGKESNERVFSQTVFDKAKLYVPDGTIERYKNTSGWNDFSNIIEKTIVREVSIDKHELSLKVGEYDTLHASVYPESSLDKTIKWSSSDENIAKVDDSGLVTALKAGEVWIKATSVSNVAVKDSCKVHVIQPVTGVSLSQSTCELNYVGENCELYAIVEPEDASKKEVTWKSYNESVCIVNNGLVIATGYGSTIVTATTVEGGYMAYCTITVTDNTPVRDIDPETSGYKVYDLQGRECKRLQKGINIIRFSDGSTKKVLNK